MKLNIEFTADYFVHSSNGPTQKLRLPFNLRSFFSFHSNWVGHQIEWALASAQRVYSILIN